MLQWAKQKKNYPNEFNQAPCSHGLLKKINQKIKKNEKSKSGSKYEKNILRDIYTRRNKGSTDTKKTEQITSTEISRKTRQYGKF